MSERPRLQRPDSTARLAGPETLLIGHRPGRRRTDGAPAPVAVAAAADPGTGCAEGTAAASTPASASGVTGRSLAELEARVAAAQQEGIEVVRQAQAQFDADKEAAHTRFAADAGPALWEIHDRRLYRATHRTWDEYLTQRWNLSRSYAHRLLEMIPVQAALLPDPAFGNLVLRESQARVLVPVLREHGPEQVREVVGKTLADGERPTAKALTAARAALGYVPATAREWEQGEPAPAPEPPTADQEESRLALGDLERLAGVLRAALRDLPDTLATTAARSFPGETRSALADLRRQLRRATRLTDAGPAPGDPAPTVAAPTGIPGPARG
ncbi:hypothetical protein GCM10009665_05170 [Kitasatospora nipponensis]|uniref:DUF222 domain-containing protein n=1 Tax=Kitasatospora nipponensis TaxID=258049 RepID=A0ABN1VPD6_9ACTN